MSEEKFPLQHFFELKHQLSARNDFIELILTKLRIRFAEIRPGVNIVDHQLEIVAVDIVVETARDGANAVVAHLSRVQTLPPDGGLKLLRDQEVTCRYIVPVRCEVWDAWHTVESKTIHFFLKVFPDYIKR